jgi:hypothetical protein
MKNKWIWINLLVIIVLGLIAGVGVLGYRAGLRSTNALALQGDGSTPYPRQLMPRMRDGMIVRRPAGFIGYFFLFPLQVLLGLAVLLLVVWRGVKVAKAAWNGGDHTPKPAEATVSPAGSEPAENKPPESSGEPSAASGSDQK